MHKTPPLFLFTISAIALALSSHLHFVQAAQKIEAAVPPNTVLIPESLTWHEVPKSTTTPRWSRRDSHAVYTYDGKLWVSGGIDAQDTKVNGVPVYEQSTYFNDLWSSFDGKNWKLEREHAEFPTVRSHSVVSYKGALYQYGGWSPEYGNTYAMGIWKSEDGLTWKRVVEKPDYPDREGQKVFEFKGKLWLVGGVNYFARKTYNDVWSSEDGIHWTQVTVHAPWPSRWDHDVGLFKGKMWVAGGMAQGEIGYGDVWSSEDGITWNQVTPLAPWGKRQGQEIVTYRGYMWLVTGLDAKTNEGKGDVWYTKDGIEWIKVPKDDAWLGREDQGVIVFNGAIWMLGGMDSEWNWNDDVWYTTFEEKVIDEKTPR